MNITAKTNRKAVQALSKLSLADAQLKRIYGFYNVKTAQGIFNETEAEQEYWENDLREREEAFKKAYSI